MISFRRKNKYGNIKTTLGGHKYDSRKEAKRGRDLSILEKTGAITQLKKQHSFVLQESFYDNEGSKQRKITYVADFYYFDNISKKSVVEDVKGYKTQTYQIKKKLFKKKFPEIVFVEI